MTLTPIPRRPRDLRRLAVATLFVGTFAFEVLMPVRGLVMRWHDGDTDGDYRYSWHMYSTLDKVKWELASTSTP